MDPNSLSQSLQHLSDSCDATTNEWEPSISSGHNVTQQQDRNHLNNTGSAHEEDTVEEARECSSMKIVRTKINLHEKHGTTGSAHIKEENLIEAKSRSLPQKNIRRSETTSNIIKQVLSPPLMAKNIRLSAVKEPPRIPEVIHWDILTKEARWMKDCFLKEHKSKIKLFKAVAQSAVKYLASKESRLLKQKEDEEKRMRLTARSLALNVREFWKVIETVVSQRLQTTLKDELRQEKEAKQTEFVAEAAKYAQAVSEGLRSWDNGLDSQMIRTKETEKYFTTKGSDDYGKENITQKIRATKTIKSEAIEEEIPSPTPEDDFSSEGWSDQEEEDAILDGQLSDESTESNSSENELEELQKEMDMDLDDLIAKFHAKDAITMEVPSSLFQERNSSVRSKRKRKRDQLRMVTNHNDHAGNSDESKIPKKRQKVSPRGGEFSSPSQNTPETSQTNSPSAENLGNDASLGCDQQLWQTLPVRRRPITSSDNEGGITPLQDIGHASLVRELPGIPTKRPKRQKPTKPHRRAIERKREESKSIFHADQTHDNNEIISDVSLKDDHLCITPGMCPIPFLLRAQLRTYQHEGLTWLLTLHDNMANGILADEMGLGKTIQTIALLAYLACYRGIWGPHLVVAPSSVLLNWETEFKRFLPGFKVLTYYGKSNKYRKGGRKDREKKRQGWNEPFAFHVCIVSYTLVVTDSHIFRRKAWYYMILDEAQNIKNHQTQKWQTMLNFNSQRRLLLTGTPLQNDLTELWALMHFLMPDLFESHTDWKEVFSDPLIRALECDSVEREQNLVTRLHSILRPFLLRRLKREVEGQMPSKYEHVIRCTLTKRQRGLYDEFIENRTTKATMESSDYFGLLNILMQLRKICNHPDLLEPREISTQLGDEVIIRPTLIIPSCAYLSLNESWAMSVEQLLNRIPHTLSLMSLATTEVEGADYSEATRFIDHNKPECLHLSSPSDRSSNVEIALCYEEFERMNRKEVEDSARGISRFPLVCVVSETTTAAGIEGKATIEPLEGKTKRNRAQSSLVKSDAVGGIKFLSNRCQLCSFIREMLLTPLQNDTNGRLTTELTSERGEVHHYSAKNPTVTLKHRLPSMDTTINGPKSATSLFHGSLIKRRKIDDSQVSKPLFPTPFGSLESRPFLEIPSSESNTFRSKLVQLLTTPTRSSSTASNSSFNSGLLCGFPPKLSEAIVLGLISAKSTFVNEQSFCYHVSHQSPYDSTAIVFLPQLPHLVNLPSRYCIGTSTCPILEPLAQQISLRYPNRRWLQRSRQTLRMAAQTALPRNTTTGSNIIGLYRKILFDQAEKHNADPKGNVLNEKALAAQWVHTTATAVGVIRRSLNLEYLVEHPAGDDDPLLKQDGHYWSCHFSPSFEVFPPYRARLPTRCLFGPRLRHSLQSEIWRNYPKCFSILRGTEEDSKLMNSFDRYMSTSTVLECLCPIPEEIMKRHLQKLLFTICIHTHRVRPLGPVLNLRGPFGHQTLQQITGGINEGITSFINSAVNIFHPIMLSQRCLFPSKRALQDDCGKLVVLAKLLRQLKSEGHKCILFTQMSKMLDILEGFINLHAFTYVRLDGSTKIEQRQRIVEAFNSDPRIFIFMSSTRAGGVGLNLIGADTVIFYDTDWNPAMDRQAMDRCHRIGQTRDVHIYRLITEHTIEENILRKQLLKRMLDDVVVDQGKFTTQKLNDYLDRSDVKEIFKTSFDTVDLYVTRTLHESQVEQLATHSKSSITGTPTGDSAAAFEAAIARIEDLDDQLALEQISIEKTMEMMEFEKEFEDSTVSHPAEEPIETETRKTNGEANGEASLAILGLGQPKTKEKAPSNESKVLPYWLKMKSECPSSATYTTISSRTEMSIDSQTSFYVSDVVRYAIQFTEENLPPSIVSDVAAIQLRLDYLRESYQQSRRQQNCRKAHYSRENREEMFENESNETKCSIYHKDR